MLADRIRNQRFFPKSELTAAKARADALNPDGWHTSVSPRPGRRTSNGSDGGSPDEVRRYRQAVKAFSDAVRAYSDLLDAANGGIVFCLIEGSMYEKYIPDFLEKLHRAQTFKLSPQFALTTLEKLATPETIVKSREFFNLSHNPMWLEWHYDEEGLRDFLEGALVFVEDSAPKGQVMAYVFFTLKGYCTCKLVRFYPDTLRLENDDMTIDWELVSGAPSDGGKREIEIDLVTDFIIRINSPRITEVRQGEDLTALNKKRARNGKLPLYEFLTVELNQDVKRGLRMAGGPDSEPGGHHRLHWRRGHFKCCRTGIFWWNPHLAGRRDLGVIEKEYAA